MCLFGVTPRLFNQWNSTWYDFTTSPAVLFLIGSTNVVSLSISHITIMYWLPSLELTRDLPIWSEYIVFTSSSWSTLILMNMYLCFFLGLSLESSYLSSPWSIRLHFVDCNPEGVFHILPLFVSYDSRNCLCAIFTIMSYHDM